MSIGFWQIVIVAVLVLGLYVLWANLRELRRERDKRFWLRRVRGLRLDRVFSVREASACTSA